MKKIFTFIFLFTFIIIYSGCSKKDNKPSTNNQNTDIPSDPGNVTVPTTVINNIQPTATFSKTSGNESRIRLNLTGMLNPVTNLPIQLVAQQNLFVTEDSKVKGMLVTKVGSGNILKADIVFAVDNSGSMDEEADSVAASIIKFSQKLQSSGLDVKLAVVGYQYGNVNGGINFTNATAIQTYLNRSYGTYRTEGFSGTDSASLENKALTFGLGLSDENGVLAVFFADSNYSWRSDAQRVFINFTDESVQPNGLYEWSTENLCDKLSGKITVHTVWSGDADTANAYTWQALYDERPWDMSKCTGGTVVLVPGDASGLDLSQLPVTGALSNSYLIEFLTSGSASSHTVEITVKENNADGKRIYQNITY